MAESTRSRSAETEDEPETVADVQRRIDRADISELADIETEEREGQNRKGVLSAVESRRQELTSIGADEPQAAVYTLQELMDGAEAAFGVPPEVVAGAMRLAGSTYATKESAQSFITTFLARPV